MSDPTPPAVSDAMREAVARFIGEGQALASADYHADRLLSPESPIASELARLTERAERAEGEAAASAKRAKAANRRADKADKERKYFKLTRRAEHEARVAAEAETARLRAALEDLREVANDLAQLSIKEGDNKAAGALQYVSGFISDRLAALSSQEQAETHNE